MIKIYRRGKIATAVFYSSAKLKKGLFLAFAYCNILAASP